MRQIAGRAPGQGAVKGTNGLLRDPAFADGLQAVGARGLSFDPQVTPERYDLMARVLERKPPMGPRTDTLKPCSASLRRSKPRRQHDPPQTDGADPPARCSINWRLTSRVGSRHSL
jgi:hypothetical protein